MSAGVNKINSGDTVVGGALVTANIGGQGNVFVNGNEICVDGAIGDSHAPCPLIPIHCGGAWNVIAATNNVYAWGIAVSNGDDSATCGHGAGSGSSNVYAGG